MRNDVLAALTVFSASFAQTVSAGEIDPDDCTYDGFPLYGSVEIVDSFPDITVKEVTSFPDLKVEPVDNFADDCGEWEIVESFPDLSIQYVDSFADIEVQFVTSFPGLD